jgi:E3 ubiquitin-protein ligase DMA1/2
MCASAASPSSVASDLFPSSPAPRPGGLFRRLTQLRTYTRILLASHPSSSSGQPRSRTSGAPLTLDTGGRAESSASSSANEAGSHQAPCLEGGSNNPIRPTGSSIRSSSDQVHQELPFELPRLPASGDSRTTSRREVREMAPAVAGGLISVIPDSGDRSDHSAPSRSEGRSSETTLHRQIGGAELAASNADRRSAALKPKQRAIIRFYPYQDPHETSRPSLPFAPVTRALPSEDAVIRVGRYSERDGIPAANPTEPSDAPVGFKSKVVSRKHCEFSLINGQWHMKDVGSSSGTFLNRMRLSQPNMVSRLYAVRDGDIVQLGIDFRGGEEMIFRCVRIRIECNRTWQRKPNEFKYAFCLPFDRRPGLTDRFLVKTRRR